MHFRVKEIKGTAHITRFYENRIRLETGDFFYPEELTTLELDGDMIYWNDTTGEVFTVGTTVAAVVGVNPAPVEPVVEAPAEPVAEPVAKAPAAE